MSPPLDRIDTSPKPPASADVVVIGGGIVGVFAAYYLAKRGVSVALVGRPPSAGRRPDAPGKVVSFRPAMAPPIRPRPCRPWQQPS